MNDATIINNALPKWALMWLLGSVLFFAGKAAALMIARGKITGWKLPAFVFLWPGMDVKPWTAGTSFSRADVRAPVIFCLVKMLLGSLLLWGLARHFTQPLAAGWTGMIGFILVLHFGLFHAIALFWQSAGIPVVPIMRNPIAAVSLAEFWGRRWNLAFRDLTHLFLFRPITRKWGHNAALWISFGASGLVHDLVISVPAGAGFGLPTGYFLLQALGITLEKRFKNKTILRLWLFTHAFTALPAFFLFHPPFVERVMVPFFQLIRALP